MWDDLAGAEIFIMRTPTVLFTWESHEPAFPYNVISDFCYKRDNVRLCFVLRKQVHSMFWLYQALAQ